jgi:NAD(P)-dependent dehydrogenase (short-subunit alcohol dehydrogenase family)
MMADASILNISSISVLRASSRSSAYGAVKAALMHYTASQAKMLARKGIRVNAVAPGSIEFPVGTWEERKTSNPKLYQTTPATVRWATSLLRRRSSCPPWLRGRLRKPIRVQADHRTRWR